jgi:uncharacterized iron-regulated membrane protein
VKLKRIVFWTHLCSAIVAATFILIMSVTGASNLVFLFLVLSGIYIWLPEVWRWSALKFRMLFDLKPANGKMRDYNWHHVFAFWAMIPLLLIVLSGVVTSHGWANQLVFTAFGASAPQRGGPPGEGPDRQTIAGLAPLAACFLAYTGLALAYRRLIRPLFRRG